MSSSASSATSESSARLLMRVRTGELRALGSLLDPHRRFLQRLATHHLPAQLRGRISPSDVVQETFLRAHETFGQFRGGTQRELVAWLRQILHSRLVELVEKHVQAEKRDVRREVTRRGSPQDSGGASRGFEQILADRSPSPSSAARHHEESQLLAAEMARLPQDYREVLTLRNLDGLAFAEIATRMDRTSAAIRMLWLRAMEELKRRLQEKGVL